MAIIPLPKGVRDADLKYRSPPANIGCGKRYQDWRAKNQMVPPRELMLFYTERFGWVINTLQIGSGRAAERTYGITLKGELVRVGNGPHVKARARIHLYEDRLTDLQPLIDLYNKGMETANDTRDRISSRRAQAANRRMSWL